MSVINDLISQYCPNGVKTEKISKLFEWRRGMSDVSKKWKENGNCKFIDYMNVYKNIKVDINNTPFATVKKLNHPTLQKGDLLFTSASETPDECAISAEIEDEITEELFIDDHLFGLRIKEKYKDLFVEGYLKYAFRSKQFRKQLRKAVRGVTRFYIAKKSFMKLEIAVPPVEVQREIVLILDSFVDLTNDLKEELEEREKQYKHYLDRLISFELKE